MNDKDDMICRRSIHEFGFKSYEANDGKKVFHISGYASTADIDEYNEIVEPEAFREWLPKFMEFPILLFGHDWYSKPIGKIVEARIDDNGLWVEAEIYDTVDGRDVVTLIEHDILKAFSIGFVSLAKEEPGEKGDPVIVKKLRLYEISVVNVPANASALFEQAKSMQLQLRSLKPSSGGGGAIHRKESIRMGVPNQDALETIKNVEAMVGTHETALESVSGEVNDLQKNQASAARLINELQEKQKEQETGHITKGEFETYVEKLSGTIAELNEKIEKAKGASNLIAQQKPMLQALEGKTYLRGLRKEDGTAYDPEQRNMYSLFLEPVDYNSYGEDGHNLQLFRRLTDALIIIDTYFSSLQRMGKMHGYKGALHTKTGQRWLKMFEIVDPASYKAMYSTGTGTGDEWVPTAMGAELYDLYTIESTLERYFTHFDMASNPYQWPIKTSNPTLYRAGEAAVNDPSEWTKSDIGTSNITFTTETFGVVIAVSPEQIEDAIIAMVPEIQRSLVQAAIKGYESLIINGDDTSTHRDTAAGYTSASPESYEDGLRMLAIDRSATLDTQSTTAGYGDATTAFKPEDLRYLRLGKMGKYGQKASECVWVTTMSPYMYMLSFDPTAMGGRYGVNSTYRQGDLDYFDGSPICLTDQMKETLDSSGLYTGASSHKGVLIFNKTAFRIGERRGIELEYEKNIRTQQLSFVGSMRKSFKTLAGTSDDPVAYGINIE